MSILNYVLQTGGISTVDSKESISSLHPKQIDFSSYGINQIDLVAFKVGFKYVSTKGKSSVKEASRLFLVAYDKLPSREYGERADRCKKYFLEWASNHQSIFNKVTIISFEELGDVSFKLDYVSGVTSLREFILSQNKEHIHFNSFNKAHEKNCIIDLELKMNMYELSYRYETVRNNVKQSKRLIFTTGSFDEVYFPYMLNTSIQKDALGEFRQLSNVKILEGNLIGEFLLSA